MAGGSACQFWPSEEASSVIFPFKDDDRLLVRPAFVTGVFIFFNVAVFLLQLYAPNLVYGFGAVPYELTKGVDLKGDVLLKTNEVISHFPGPGVIQLTTITSLFLHGGWLHLGGNLVYLYIFGDNVEHRFGSGLFIIVYLVCGIVAAVTQVALAPLSLIPIIGASGAVSGVMGAYLALFPRNRVVCLFVFRVISLPAAVVLLGWLLLQVVSGYLERGGVGGGGVAYGAHVGGFVAGLLLGVVARMVLKEEPETELGKRLKADDKVKRLW